MLSAETAVGKYPVETVDMMKNVIKFTERYLTTKGLKSNE
jgi:pyruvate kinase